MKIISIKGNNLTVDLSEEEYNILLRYGLQKWIDKNHGKNKVKVLPPCKTMDKKVKQYEMGEGFSKECVTIAVTEAIKDYIKKEKKNGKSRRAL